MFIPLKHVYIVEMIIRNIGCVNKF